MGTPGVVSGGKKDVCVEENPHFFLMVEDFFAEGGRSPSCQASFFFPAGDLFVGIQFNFEGFQEQVVSMFFHQEGTAGFRPQLPFKRGG